MVRASLIYSNQYENNWFVQQENQLNSMDEKYTVH